MHRGLKHALLTFAAIAFLIEAWLWDKSIALGRWAAGLLPWEAFKAVVARLVERLPPYGALPLFLLPVGVVEPLKVVAVREIAHGHFLAGLLAFVVLKFVGVGLVAFVFDLTRAKLLSIGWFARFYAWVVKWRDIAHAFIEPYKVAVRARVAELRARADAWLRSLEPSSGGGRLMVALLRVRARIRRTRA
ncbi:hypothetical protein [Rhodoblastus sp.]|jgi:hypothetical protein|uniref:hypothetical protein n=1 Tax=Rhodoblastus sp. TaxID=1962975 RepID=UPI002634CF99|nr:hypothetical protein [Rhodoblastus sp.]